MVVQTPLLGSGFAAAAHEERGRGHSLSNSSATSGSFHQDAFLATATSQTSVVDGVGRERINSLGSESRDALLERALNRRCCRCSWKVLAGVAVVVFVVAIIVIVIVRKAIDKEA